MGAQGMGVAPSLLCCSRCAPPCGGRWRHQWSGPADRPPPHCYRWITDGHGSLRPVARYYNMSNSGNAAVTLYENITNQSRPERTQRVWGRGGDGEGVRVTGLCGSDVVVGVGRRCGVDLRMGWMKPLEVMRRSEW